MHQNSIFRTEFYVARPEFSIVSRFDCAVALIDPEVRAVDGSLLDAGIADVKEKPAAGYEIDRCPAESDETIGKDQEREHNRYDGCRKYYESQRIIAVFSKTTQRPPNSRWSAPTIHLRLPSVAFKTSNGLHWKSSSNVPPIRIRCQSPLGNTSQKIIAPLRAIMPIDFRVTEKGYR